VIELLREMIKKLLAARLTKVTFSPPWVCKKPPFFMGWCRLTEQANPRNQTFFSLRLFNVLAGKQSEQGKACVGIKYQIPRPDPRAPTHFAFLVAHLLSLVRTRYSADARSELRQQQIELEARLQFLNDALSVGEIELDAVRGRLSVELCQQVREEWVSEIRRILQALKEISQANEALDRIRHQLEADGIRTGALPYSKFNLAGSWNDPLGGKVLGYQIEVAENFPELARDADRQVKILRARLIERERKFAAREEVQDHD
jgi:hypothetical protein